MPNIVPREIYPSYQVETPPESPTSKTTREKTRKEAGLSPCLNKMSLKRLREGDEEEMDQKKFKTKEKESSKRENEISVRMVKGKAKVNAKSQNEKKRNEMIRKRAKYVLKKKKLTAASNVPTTGSRGCPITATQNQRARYVGIVRDWGLS